MSTLRLILATLIYHLRGNVAVACGVAAATAVLTGALLVGDSMRGSLRGLTLDRLGRIDDVLVAPQFFSARSVEEMAKNPEFARQFGSAVPAILLRTGLETADAKNPRRAGGVNVIGCQPAFWALGDCPNFRLSENGTVPLRGPAPGPDEIVLNEPLAQSLGAVVGDTVLLRLPRPGAIPADSPLGRKRDTVESHRVRVLMIIPATGLGRFALQPNQRLPLNAYVNLEWLQTRLKQPGRANTILVTGRDDMASPADSDKVLGGLWHPTLADYGIRVEKTARGYFNITSENMLLPPAVEKAITERLVAADARLQIQPSLVYLATSIACGKHDIPYSIIAALDFEDKPPLGPWLTTDGKPIARLADNQIVLNSWAADDLGARPGDTIRVRYFEPESLHGEVREQSVELTLAAVTPLSSAADDPAFTPNVAGVTDQGSMANWDAPFPFDARRIRDKDDRYWQQHRGTPKAFVRLATGRRLWASRFGQTTSIRVAPWNGMTPADLEAKIKIPPAEIGWVFQPVKAQGLAASAGTTPFSLLFLGFSFFIIAAAVTLVVLLFRLGIDSRAAEIGILLAVGLSRRKVGRLLAAEGFVVAAVGSLLGVFLGLGYAALMLAGLRTWWLGAVVTPFLRLHVAPESLLIGYVAGVLVTFAAIAWSVRRVARVAPRQLLSGETASDLRSQISNFRSWIGDRISPSLLLGILLAVTVVVPVVARLPDEFRALAFFLAGFLALVELLALVWISLRKGVTGAVVVVGRGNLFRLALRNAARNPGRSTLTIGLMAAACFLITAVSAFRLDPSTQPPKLSSGNGGFALVAQSDLPIYQDLNTPEGRSALDFSDEDSTVLARCRTIGLRVRAGDDASCLNLYQPRQPRVLGMPHEFIDHDGFAWTKTAAKNAEDRKNPWRLLPVKSEIRNPKSEISNLKSQISAQPVPVIMEENTATYSLHLSGVGARYDLPDGHGGNVPLEVAALLDNSIFQGDLLIDEKAFLAHFPETSGYRFFLVEASPQDAPKAAEALQRSLADYGLTVETTAARLSAFLAVQNTYLSTFQSLGSLGLLLGTIGLAAVQLRNVFERRRELALMRAVGFARGRLATMVMLENVVLLCGGLGSGVAAALVALLPHLLFGGAAVPWRWLAATLAVVLGVGLTAGFAAVRATLSAPLLPALREE